MPAKKAAGKDNNADVDNREDQDAVTMDRRRGDRRSDSEEAADTNAPRPKKQRRRHIDPTTCERDYNNDEIEFMRAMDDYKRAAGRMFPTCSEVLEVIRSLGYFKLSDEQMDSLGLIIQEPGTAEANEAADSEEAELEEALEA